MTVEQIRKPRFSGQFYPGSLNKIPPKRAILIGPSHHHYFMGFSLAGYEKYRTPLGDLEVDLGLQQTLASATGFDFEPEAHMHEHSLEVILPMLQYVVSSDIKIMPIIAGSTSRANITNLADALASHCDALSDVVIISSDLSHFYNYNEARRLDQETLAFILEEDSDSINERSGDGGRLACGHSGISVAIKLAKLWGLGKPEVLIYYNSGDSGGDRNRVVGYASVAYPAPDLAIEPGP
ncbi:MAG: AmmeMemoRadiSam system protein B [bacterium]|nr:AmmeMemoRadiSam system protein B [bacterium]